VSVTLLLRKAANKAIFARLWQDRRGGIAFFLIRGKSINRPLSSPSGSATTSCLKIL
jgi:hypothetical protein